MTGNFIDRRALTAAAYARLQAVTNQTAFKGEATDVPTVGGYAKPYTVLFVSTGADDEDGNLADTAVALDWLIQITCAAGYVDDLNALVTRVDAAFYRWAMQVDGLVCGPFKPPPGYQAMQLLDRDETPHRPYVPLQYATRVTAT